MKSFVLYRFYDQNKMLLYIGVTINAAQRFSSHSRDKDWWLDVTDIKLERYYTRTDLLRAERTAIAAEHPLYNIMHQEPWYSSQPVTARIRSARQANVVARGVDQWGRPKPMKGKIDRTATYVRSFAEPSNADV